jgi:hypothetical protein
MNKEEYDKYKKVVDELDGYDICDEFNLGTYELKNEKKLLEIVLMYYFKNQDELQEKDKEIERLNNEIKTLLKENGNKEKVIIKQNNIINELEESIQKEIDRTNKLILEDISMIEINNIRKMLNDTRQCILFKLRELKGNNND